MDINWISLKQRAIGKIPLLSQLPHTESEILANALVLKECKKGSAIIHSHQRNQEIMFVADGMVDVKRSSADGREVIIARLCEGEFFGEISLLTGSTRTADVVTAASTRISELALLDVYCRLYRTLRSLAKLSAGTSR